MSESISEIPSATPIGRRRSSRRSRRPPRSRSPRRARPGQAREVKVGDNPAGHGPLAFEAQLALNGLLLAVDEITSGGIKSLGGARSPLLPGDTQNKVELGNSEAARLIDQGGHRADRPLLEPGGRSRSGRSTEKNKTPFLLLATWPRQRAEGGLHYCFRMQPQRARDGHPHGGQHDRDGQERGHPDQARRDHARGRQLRHHHGTTTSRPSRARWATSWCSGCPTTCAPPTSPAELSKGQGGPPRIFS